MGISSCGAKLMTVSFLPFGHREKKESGRSDITQRRIIIYRLFHNDNKLHGSKSHYHHGKWLPITSLIFWLHFHLSLSFWTHLDASPPFFLYEWPIRTHLPLFPHLAHLDIYCICMENSISPSKTGSISRLLGELVSTNGLNFYRAQKVSSFRRPQFL